MILLVKTFNFRKRMVMTLDKRFLHFELDGLILLKAWLNKISKIKIKNKLQKHFLEIFNFAKLVIK